MNSVALLGRLTTDPELKTTPNGVSVTSFNIAVDRAYKPKDQERQTDFITCVAWRGTAEFISKFFRKGQRIAVKGELQSRQYTANDGSQRKVLEVVVDNAFFCESKAVPNVDVNAEPSAEYKTAVQNNFEEIPTDEDLPF
jgi:single-strand DNA-binding protein